jgi:hypothetical protein
VGPRDFIAFDASPGRDPDGARLRGVLEAHFSLERAQHLRRLLVHWVALLALPVWLAALRPGWLPLPTGRALLAGWALSAVAAAVAVVREWRLRVRRDAETADIAAELPQVPQVPPPPER